MSDQTDGRLRRVMVSVPAGELAAWQAAAAADERPLTYLIRVAVRRHLAARRTHAPAEDRP